MSRSLYDGYKFLDPEDTKPLKEVVIKGNDDLSRYGPVVWAVDEMRVRYKDGLISVWIGAKVEATVRKL